MLRVAEGEFEGESEVLVTLEAPRVDHIIQSLRLAQEVFFLGKDTELPSPTPNVKDTINRESVCTKTFNPS